MSKGRVPNPRVDWSAVNDCRDVKKKAVPLDNVCAPVRYLDALNDSLDCSERNGNAGFGG